MWESEHGPSRRVATPGRAAASRERRDQPHRQGANYGWPTIVGDETSPGMRKPVAHASSSPAWAPAAWPSGPTASCTCRSWQAPSCARSPPRATRITSQASLFDGHLWPPARRHRRPDPPVAHHVQRHQRREGPAGAVRPRHGDIPGRRRVAARPRAASPAPSYARSSATSWPARPAPLRSKRARRLAGVSRLRLRDRVLPAGRLSIVVDRPGIRRKRSRLQVLAGKAGHPRRPACRRHHQAQPPRAGACCAGPAGAAAG